MVAKEQLRRVSERGEGGSAIRILLTLRLVRVPVFGDASLHEKLAACFGPKQLCAMQFLPVVLEIHFAAAASVTPGEGRGRLLWQLLGLLPQTEASAISTSPLGYATPRTPEPIPSLCSLIRYPFLSFSLFASLPQNCILSCKKGKGDKGCHAYSYSCYIDNLISHKFYYCIRQASCCVWVCVSRNICKLIKAKG